MLLGSTLVSSCDPSKKLSWTSPYTFSQKQAKDGNKQETKTKKSNKQHEPNQEPITTKQNTLQHWRSKWLEVYEIPLFKKMANNYNDNFVDSRIFSLHGGANGTNSASPFLIPSGWQFTPRSTTSTRFGQVQWSKTFVFTASSSSRCLFTCQALSRSCFTAIHLINQGNHRRNLLTAEIVESMA